MCDAEGKNIRKISGGQVSSYSNNKNQFMENPPEPGAFNTPVGILVAPDGSIYVSTLQDNVITKIGAGPVAGQTGAPGYRDGDGPNARFSFNTGIAFDSDGNILVCDYGNHVIRKVIFE